MSDTVRPRRFQTSTRNPLVLGAALAACALAAYGQLNGAPALWLAVVGLPGVAALAAWFADTRSGWTVGPRRVEFHVGRDWNLELDPARILHATRIPDSEGPDSVQLALRGGERRILPDQCVGRVGPLLDALEEVGVEVRDGL